MPPNGKILIIDDELHIRFILKKTLEKAGYQVATAENGEEALELIAEENFDLIMIDLIMPLKDGFETILALHALETKTRIIAMSGGWNGKPECYLRIAARMGASRAISKPFSKQALLEAVASEISTPLATAVRIA